MSGFKVLAKMSVGTEESHSNQSGLLANKPGTSHI
jgi:hypothetical protein